MSAKLSGTTEAFEAANIMARTSDYVAERYVEIGDHVKAGQLLAEIPTCVDNVTITVRSFARQTSSANEAGHPELAQLNLLLVRLGELGPPTSKVQLRRFCFLRIPAIT
jgi:multidrug efflux pump subunit AcrA (membrane-fusion protein)